MDKSKTYKGFNKASLVDFVERLRSDLDINFDSIYYEIDHDPEEEDIHINSGHEVNVDVVADDDE